jgi:hypothetical protein
VSEYTLPKSQAPEWLLKELRKMDEYSAKSYTEPVTLVISESLEEYYREAYGDGFFSNIRIVRPARVSPFAQFVYPDVQTEA